MTQLPLNDAKIDPAVDQVEGTAVPELVGVRSPFENNLAGPGDHAADIGGADRPASAGGEDQGVAALPAAEFLQVEHDRSWYSDDAPPAPLPALYYQVPEVGREVADSEGEGFGTAQGGAIHSANQQAVSPGDAVTTDSGEQVTDLVGGQDSRGKFVQVTPPTTSIAYIQHLGKRFIAKNIQRQCRELGIWREFCDKWLVCQEIVRHRSRHKRIWAGFLAACDLFPQLNLDEARRAWQTYSTEKRKTLTGGRTKRRLMNAMKNLTTLQVAEAANIVEENFDMMRQEERQAAATMRQAVAAQVQAEAIKILAEASSERVRLQGLKQQATQAAERAKPTVQTGMATAPVESGPTDLLRDVKWTYENLHRLLITGSDGQQRLDAAVLREAPSSGSLSMANFALVDFKTFFRVFVHQLLPRDSAARIDEEERARARTAESLDPSFSQLTAFFAPKARDKGE